MDLDGATGAKDDVDMISLPEKSTAPSAAKEDDAQQANGQPVAPAAVDDASPDPASTPSDGTADLPLNNGIPPVPEQIKTIEALVRAFAEAPARDGDVVYLVSHRWLRRAQAQVGGLAASKEIFEGPPGPVDNADIIDEVVKDINGGDVARLKPGLNGDNFELLPKDAWDLLVAWYGLAEGQIPVVRVAHNTSPDAHAPNVQFEFHPPVFTFHRLWSMASPLATAGETQAPATPAFRFMCSTSVKVVSFLKAAKEQAGIPLDRKVRLWRVMRELPARDLGSQTPKITTLSTPPDSPQGDGTAELDPQASWTRLFVDVTDFMKLAKGRERETLDVQDNTNDANYNGHSTLSYYLTVPEAIVLDEQIDRTLWVSTYKPKATGKDHAVAARGLAVNAAVAASAEGRASTSGRSSPAPQGPVTRGRAKQKSGRQTGCVGLSNLGNTCYMNSALQCLRSVEELTKYFLVHEHDREVNYTNLLGFKGQIAKTYGELLDDVYRDPTPGSVAPRPFKTMIGRHASQFSGYGQQDSQEFLGFLLDALQEDLSRVAKKPYIEKPDSTDDMINNPVAIREMADKVWDITKKRDDSVIADLFTGMYKSTLICPVCEKVSITFDPFNNLTLPLPIQNYWMRHVRYYPLNEAPLYIDVEMDKASSIKSLKEFISARVGVPADRLFAAEEWSEKFFKVYDDFSCISDEIQSNDTPVVFELESAPTNVGAKLPKKKYRSMLNIGPEENDELPKWDSPLADRLVVPVLHRFNPSDMSSIRRRPKNLPSVTPPHVIVLTPQEARSEDAIRRKILEKIATFSGHAAFLTPEDPEEENNTDVDLVATTSSDADSAGDSKVVARSIEGEDDIVDVTMKDSGAADKTATAAPKYPKLLRRFNDRRPKWVDPKEFLDPQFQNLFGLSYFSEAGSAIPTGWTGGRDDSKVYPRLDSRLPPPEENSPSPADGSSDNESGQDDIPPAGLMSVTRMADESDEEEDDGPRQALALRERSNVKVGIGGGRRANRPMKTYSKKGNKRRNKQLPRSGRQQQQNTVSSGYGSSPADSSYDGGPLVRLGEGIIVDWNPRAYDVVYGMESTNGPALEATFAEPLPILEDPDLVEKRAIRQQRRKTGLTLDECLDEFEKDEILSENDTWYCPRCKEHRRASKKFDLWKMPDILVIHLKRFSSSGWRRDKIDTTVDFPVENLDLTRRVLDKQDGKEEVYDLIAVDDHWGGLGGGHYTAFAKNFIDGEWYEYNDSSVTAVKSLARIVTPAAYLLFYRRRSTVPLGGPRFRSIMDRFDNPSQGDDENMSDAGEGQRLDIVSSRIGSSSALNGAEATRRLGSRGLASDAKDAPATAAAAAEADVVDPSPPPYQAPSDADTDNIELDDDFNKPTSGYLDFGRDKDTSIRASVEDEGIGGIGMRHHWDEQNWGWTRIADHDDSGAVELTRRTANSSDTDANSMGPGVGDRDEQMSFESAAEYTLPPEPAPYELPPEATMDGVEPDDPIQ